MQISSPYLLVKKVDTTTTAVPTCHAGRDMKAVAFS
jgi:hypothetical protein